MLFSLKKIISVDRVVSCLTDENPLGSDVYDEDKFRDSTLNYGLWGVRSEASLNIIIEQFDLTTLFIHKGNDTSY